MDPLSPLLLFGWISASSKGGSSLQTLSSLKNPHKPLKQCLLPSEVPRDHAYRVFKRQPKEMPCGFPGPSPCLLSGGQETIRSILLIKPGPLILNPAWFD